MHINVSTKYDVRSFLKNNFIVPKSVGNVTWRITQELFFWKKVNSDYVSVFIRSRMIRYSEQWFPSSKFRKKIGSLTIQWERMNNQSCARIQNFVRERFDIVECNYQVHCFKKCMVHERLNNHVLPFRISFANDLIF